MVGPDNPNLTVLTEDLGKQAFWNANRLGAINPESDAHVTHCKSLLWGAGS